MWNQQAPHGHWTGLSVGATNLAGTHGGRTMIRPSEVTLNGQRLTGFVDRVGDPVPLVAQDGSRHRPELLLTEAIGAAVHAVTGGMGAPDMAIAVPAHWRPSEIDTLRRNTRDGVPVVSDATAALTALSANPGLPTRGAIVLCDFGGSGTSITLANASANYAVVGETVRFADFSGDQIDQALLTHVASGLGEATQDDPFGTAMVGSLTSLRDECRRAKERLSAETSTAIAVDLPGQRADIRVTRMELQDLIEPSFAGFLAALDDTLERYGVPLAGISAVATVGGGARIPLITQLLSEHLRAPVVTTAHPQFIAAEGAALIAQRSRVTETATTITPAPGLAAAGVAAPAAFDAGPASTTFGALAWTDDAGGEDVLPYAEAAMDTEYHRQPADSRPELRFHHEESHDDEPARRAPMVLFAMSAVAAALTAAVFGFTLLSDTTTPVDAATTKTTSPMPAAPVSSPPTPAPQAPPVTTVVVTASPKPAPRQAPAVIEHPPAPPSTPPPTTPPPTTSTPPTSTPPTWTPPTWTPPTWTPPWQLPPVDPGPGDGATDPAPTPR